MCLVQMNRIFLFEFSELGRETVLLLEAAKDILQSCRDIEVELLQAYLLVLLGVVVWVKDGGYVLGILRLLHVFEVV